MRILVVCSYRDYISDGIAPFIKEQVKALETIENEQVECAYYKIKGKGALGYIKEIPTLRKEIREYNPDIIHAHFGLSGLLANLTTRRVPVVSTYHGSDINLPKIRPFSKVAMRLSAWNIFVSKRNMALVGAIEGNKCSLIPCGVTLSESQLQTREEARKALGWAMEEKKVLFAGAFDNAVKDPDLAKQAINELNIKGRNAELVELKGYSREQVNRLMCACDAFLMTSKMEGSPQVIKEAMACGIPIVSVDVGDVAERVEGVNGCYVVHSRNKNELEKALEKALAYEGRARGRERIVESGLTNKQVANNIINIYKKIQINVPLYKNKE